MLGGVWASYSWGRFWGWDPKETWALIATLGYLAILHARMTGWIKDFGMAVGSLLGYLLVLMAWYGVNFVLGTGLHSYGFGSGGYWYVGGFVAFEIAVIAAAVLRRRQELAKHGAARACRPRRSRRTEVFRRRARPRVPSPSRRLTTSRRDRRTRMKNLVAFVVLALVATAGAASPPSRRSPGRAATSRPRASSSRRRARARSRRSS